MEILKVIKKGNFMDSYEKYYIYIYIYTVKWEYA
jgi:hypothetical protein